MDITFEQALKRPENALDTASKEQLGELRQAAAQNSNVRVIDLRGARKKAFCAGSDIKEIQRTGQMVSTETLVRAIPGIGIKLNIASRRTRLGFPEVQHGMISEITAITLPDGVGEAAALDLMLTGRIVDAEEAQRYGLVNSIAEDPYAEALSVARSLAANSLRAIELTKSLVLTHRRNRIQQFAAEVDRARIDVTDSSEYCGVVRQSPSTGRARI